MNEQLYACPDEDAGYPKCVPVIPPRPDPAWKEFGHNGDDYDGCLGLWQEYKKAMAYIEYLEAVYDGPL